MALRCPHGSQCMWRPEVSVRCLQSLFYLILWVTEPGAYQWLDQLGIFLSPPPQCWDYRHTGVWLGCQTSEFRSLSQQPLPSAILQLHRSRYLPQWLCGVWFDPVLFWEMISIFSPDWPQTQQSCLGLHLGLQLCPDQACFHPLFSPKRVGGSGKFYTRDWGRQVMSLSEQASKNLP